MGHHRTTTPQHTDTMHTCAHCLGFPPSQSMTMPRNHSFVFVVCHHTTAYMESVSEQTPTLKHPCDLGTRSSIDPLSVHPSARLHGMTVLPARHPLHRTKRFPKNGRPQFSACDPWHGYAFNSIILVQIRSGIHLQ